MDSMFGESLCNKSRKIIIYAENDKIIGIIAYFYHEKACPVIDTENWLVDNSSVHTGIVFKLLTGTQFFAQFFYKLKINKNHRIPVF